MSEQNNRIEKFNLELGGFKLNCENPGKETRKTMAVGGVVVVIALSIIGAICYLAGFSQIGMLAIGSSLGLAVKTGIGKGGKSP